MKTFILFCQNDRVQRVTGKLEFKPVYGSEFFMKMKSHKDFHEMFPGKIINKTNGVTPRRWIHSCNKELSDLITDYVCDFDEWMTDMHLIRDLANWADD